MTLEEVEGHRNAQGRLILQADNVSGRLAADEPSSEMIILLLLLLGVKMNDTTDGLGQQYISPEDAITLRGADVIIVGRGITQAVDCKATAKHYQEIAYSCYESLRTNQKSDR